MLRNIFYFRSLCFNIVTFKVNKCLSFKVLNTTGEAGSIDLNKTLSSAWFTERGV